VVAAVVACSCSQPSPVAAKPTPTGPISLSGTIGKAGYVIDVPASWNGTLFLFSHGYVAPGSANPAQDAPVAQARDWLLAHHYAMAGSSYSSTGWALQDAFKDQVALLDYFGAHVAKPKRVIAWGVSLGGIITAGLLQIYPGRFAAAMPLCGVLAGGVATWNTELDAAYAFKTLFAPGSGLQIVHITNGPNNLRQAESLFNIASQTAKGRARLSLIAALTDLPGWFDPIKPEPPSTDFAARVAAQEMWESRVDFPFAFEYRTDLEMRAGGNPSWNVGVDYARQLAGSPDAAEVAALYHAAGLSLTSDLGALNAGSRIAPDAGAAAYLQRNVSFDGRLTVPVLTIHTTGDGLVIPPNESAYAQVVSSAGDGDLLRQLFVHRAGHCAFTPAEVIAGLQVLLSRLDTGKWNDAALQPAALNVAAVAQGASLNGFFGFSEPPAFVAYQAAPYPRPFSAGSAIPA
jgi:pimeloyl-ACP methyl ester carboxylesterase